MAEIKVREIPSKIKEVKKDKEESEEDSEEDSLESIIQQLRARAAARPQVAQRQTRAVAPVLKQDNIVQMVSNAPVNVALKREEPENGRDAKPAVYEAREKSKYEAASGNTERKYDSPNAERKYSSQNQETRKPEESRKVSPVLGERGPTLSGSRVVFGTTQEANRNFSDPHDNRRDYDVNPLAENQGRKRSRML